MKVLLLHHVTALGGGTKSLIDVANMLRSHYEIVVCIPRGNSPLSDELSAQGIDYYEVKTPIPSLNLYSGRPSILSRFFLKTLFRFTGCKQLVQELLALDPEAVIFNTTVTAPIAMWMPSTVTRICFVRETMPSNLTCSIWRRILNAACDGVAFISDNERRRLSLSVCEQAVLPDCLNPSDRTIINAEIAREIIGLPQDKFTLLYMGGMSRLKGIHIMLQAMHELGDDYHLLLGGLFNREALEFRNAVRTMRNPLHILYSLRIGKLYDDLERQGKVTCLGYVRDISPCMSACDIVVFPSTKAHQPRPCIEAGAFRKPVIISDFEATREFFQDGRNALAFTPNDPHDLVCAIKLAKSDKRFLEALGYENMRMTNELHDYESVRVSTEAFLKRTIEKRDVGR